MRDLSLGTNHSALTTALCWDGKDMKGKTVKSGIYFVKLKVKSEKLNPVR